MYVEGAAVEQKGVARRASILMLYRGAKRGSRTQPILDAHTGGFERKNKKESDTRAEKESRQMLGAFVLPRRVEAARAFVNLIFIQWAIRVFFCKVNKKRARSCR